MTHPLAQANVACLHAPADDPSSADFAYDAAGRPLER